MLAAVRLLNPTEVMTMEDNNEEVTKPLPTRAAHAARKAAAARKPYRRSDRDPESAQRAALRLGITAAHGLAR